MGQANGFGASLAAISAIALLSQGLSGCVAVALAPLVAGTGLSAYKLVQLESGGSVAVDFGPDGKSASPQPIAGISRVAVWPGDAGDVRFAQKLGESGRLKVVGPATVAAAQAAHVSADLNQLTDTERDAAFSAVCRHFGVDLVFAAKSLGTKSSENMFSLDRANVKSSSDLMGYSCARRQIVWRDQMTLTIEIGASHLPSDNELAQVAGDAWAGRVVQALGAKTAEK